MIKNCHDIIDLVYLSGPMTGYDNYNFDAFNEWARILREDGYVVINPAETAGGAQHLNRHWYFRFDFACVASVDYVFLMPGWRESPGATAEAIMAHEMGVELYEIVEAPFDVDYKITQVEDLTWTVNCKYGASS